MSPLDSGATVFSDGAEPMKRGVSPGRSKTRTGTSPAPGRRNMASPGRKSMASPGRRSAASPVGRRTPKPTTSPRRTPTQTNSPPQRNASPGRRQSTASPARRRKPKVGSPATSRQCRSEEFKPRAPPTEKTDWGRTSPPAPAPVRKPAAKPRQSRLAGFGLTCHVEGCDGGANCLHI
ncbi:MAG: hypothetical protein SGBAC_006486 [Bacillariaceae sp.]